MAYVDPNSNDYKAFVEKADYYATMSINGVANGMYRMNNAEMSITAAQTRENALTIRVKALEDRVATLIEILDTLVPVVKTSNDQIGKIVDVLDMDEPVLQLVDDEFFAAAADPEKYERGQSANQRSTSV